MKHILLIAGLAGIFWASSPVRAAEPEFLKYDELLEQIRDGKVESITMGPFTLLQGTYLKEDVATEFIAQHPLDPASDPLLTDLLESQQVKVVNKEAPQPGAAELLARNAQWLLLLLVPSILLVFVIIYVIRINNKIDQVVIK